MATKKPAVKARQPLAETGAIVLAIAAGVIVLAIFLEWLLSGKGLLAQRKQADIQIEPE